MGSNTSSVAESAATSAAGEMSSWYAQKTTGRERSTTENTARSVVNAVPGGSAFTITADHMEAAHHGAQRIARDTTSALRNAGMSETSARLTADAGMHMKLMSGMH